MRPLFPRQLPEIGEDLADLVGSEAKQNLWGEVELNVQNQACVMQCLKQAREFVAGLIEDDRGMVYMIG